MDRNYWQDYWDSYYKFMALYLSELQKVYPDADIKQEYAEVSQLIEPSVRPEDYEIYDEYEYDDNNDDNEYVEESYQPSFTLPGGIGPVILPGGGQSPNPPTQPGGGQPATPFISPGGGQFTINNCRRMAIVRIVMRGGFNPSSFYLVVDRADRRSIQGFRIACEGGRIRFVPMAVEYRNINFIECAF